MAWGSPFRLSDSLGLAMAHTVEVPRPLMRVAPGVVEELSQLVAACLEKAPESRPTALAVKARLTAIADELAAPPAHALIGVALPFPAASPDSMRDVASDMLVTRPSRMPGR